MQVVEGDGSSRLGYASTTALSAGTGDILRASANPSTSVDLVLPAKGAPGSLSWSSEVVVDTSAGYITDVRRRPPVAVSVVQGKFAVVAVAGRGGHLGEAYE